MGRKKSAKTTTKLKYNRKVKNAKSKEVDGIKFRSQLEVFTYSKLIQAEIRDFKYEEDRFTLQEGFESSNESYELGKNNIFGLSDSKIRPMTYKPDFTCVKPDKTGWIIEVKGFSNDALVKGSAFR